MAISATRCATAAHLLVFAGLHSAFDHSNVGRTCHHYCGSLGLPDILNVKQDHADPWPLCEWVFPMTLIMSAKGIPYVCARWAH